MHLLSFPACAQLAVAKFLGAFSSGLNEPSKQTLLTLLNYLTNHVCIATQLEAVTNAVNLT